MLTRADATTAILEAKKRQGRTFAEIAQVAGRSKEWTASAILGQATMSEEEAGAVVDLLNLEQDIKEALQEIPLKGSLEQAVPVDPLIYRFHEITQVYGTTLKALIHEMFGDGIMSAIDFELDVQRKEDPKGDRVIVTMNGKFLPYRKW